MADQRELILARIEQILRGASGATVKRMDSNFDEADYPGVVLLDGNEQPASPDSHGVAPQRMILQPVIAFFGFAGDQAGPIMNAARVRIIKALLFDEGLVALCAAGSGGRMAYEGCTTESQLGEALLADMILNFSLTYIFKPQAL